MMSNFSIDVRHVNGSLTQPIDTGMSCKDIVEYFISDDHGAPASLLTILVETESGKRVTVTVPYDANGSVFVNIDGESI
ncbi:hypothetical protein KV802_001202 [Salmonella enterica subsp. enterica serovar Corvallis]|uniref:Uncharacterized protein n=3 Tax=Salmonella enterica TaxID=28901 RepID=A0A754G1J5_SALER|nr:hypothetical protein [Salmonella enterica]ECD6549502.1 hypothetical protein [Salmonella enterica subsp. enterica serovar Nima]ECK9500812.1 hypothetical protein [Salmonella enterica subsp. enterica serovar Infantis str. CFSAN000522]ECL4488923.1 hypothetical protein [Salmonella enterica subsp. enterica]EEI6324785.1 hypothetical protein [Salmonella enterica subsp. enterica serovar Vancouver]EEL6777016.1 hypothetical protein [Salmonella enterica subsp. enterica serovar Kingston]EHS5456256.1 hy